jgi:TorA maturation chaperone TorD
MLENEFRLDSQPARRDSAGQSVEGAYSRDECLARASVYRMLAGVFAEEPGPRFLAELRNGQLLADLARAGVRFDADFLAADLPALSDTLACEYATLFAASGGFPPVESVRLTGRYKQDPEFQVAATYRRLGFAVQKGRFEVFADQLGVELGFVAALLERCSTALEAGDEALFRSLDKEVRRFWTLHLGRWVRGYSRLVERAAQHSFYREMARFLHGFAEEEIAAMDLKRVEDLDQGRAVVPKGEIKLEFDPNEPVCGACPSGPAAGAPTTGVHALHDLRF